VFTPTFLEANYPFFTACGKDAADTFLTNRSIF